jgi:hypothetical protein
MVILRLLLVLLIFNLFSCKTIEPKLKSTKNFAAPNVLSLDGYYYQNTDKGSYAFFLYRNGTYLGLNGYGECNNLKCYESSIQELRHLTTKSNWGVYEIRGLKILIKHYFPIGFGSYRIRTFEGIIKSPTKIVIESINEEKLGDERVYTFHAYSPKPDSTNKFIDYR